MALDKKSGIKDSLPLRGQLEEALNIYKELLTLVDEQKRAIKEDDLAKLCEVVLRKERLIKENVRIHHLNRSISELNKAGAGQGFKIDNEVRQIGREAASALSKIMDAEKESMNELKIMLEGTKQELRKLQGEELSARNYALPRPAQPMFLDLLK